MSLFQLRPEVEALRQKLDEFVRDECQPAEQEYEDHVANRTGEARWSVDAVPPVLSRLKNEARRLGLWNLFLPHPLPPTVSSASREPTMYLSNREYGILCEITGRSFLAPEACNCSAPDTGNMEVLLKHGSAEQQREWLGPLLDGRIRSAFLMTEPDVASSDATNIETRLTKMYEEGGKVKYVLNGTKWWSTGAMDPRCTFALVLAKMDYSHPSCRRNPPDGADCNFGSDHGAHTVVLVPMNKPGVRLVRALTVFGYDDAPHGHAEVALENVELDASSLVLGEGRGFEIAQSRLGPGRIHHCMRAVGLAARCYDLMLQRSLSRKTFGKYLAEHGGCQEMIADSAADLEAARLLTLSCAAAIDEKGPKDARDKIASIKVSVPELTSRVADRAVQVFGGAGVCQDYPLARALVGLRTLRIADGPDAVHKRTVARIEIKKMLEAAGIDIRSKM
mmetsp:Transcript_50/g.108  ORF Transcript_50/g.108 Transcript_50/m.108 type:complete len:450 (+) Transcript_50:219-1568(+)